MKNHENPEEMKLEIKTGKNGGGELLYLVTLKVRYKDMKNFVVQQEEYYNFMQAANKVKSELDKWQNYQQQKEIDERWTGKTGWTMPEQTTIITGKEPDNE